MKRCTLTISTLGVPIATYDGETYFFTNQVDKVILDALPQGKYYVEPAPRPGYRLAAVLVDHEEPLYRIGDNIVWICAGALRHIFGAVPDALYIRKRPKRKEAHHG